MSNHQEDYRLRRKMEFASLWSKSSQGVSNDVPKKMNEQKIPEAMSFSDNFTSSYETV